MSETSSKTERLFQLLEQVVSRLDSQAVTCFPGAHWTVRLCRCLPGRDCTKLACPYRSMHAGPSGRRPGPEGEPAAEP